ncbi:MAG: hypothetical protein QGF81_03140, partial [Dehalococcoidia bacterium]|nr:hypothetical protein [Dehalococcoidia bacterium]
ECPDVCQAQLHPGTPPHATSLTVQHGWGEEERHPSQRRRLSWDDSVFWGRRGIVQTILYCDKATIAQIHGYCYGGPPRVGPGL